MSGTVTKKVKFVMLLWSLIHRLVCGIWYDVCSIVVAIHVKFDIWGSVIATRCTCRQYGRF